jgi:hypothetical protein
MVACSKNEVVDVNRNNDVIEFGVVANSLTRAETVYSNTNMPEEFTVWATYGNKTFIDGDIMKVKRLSKDDRFFCAFYRVTGRDKNKVMMPKTKGVEYSTPSCLFYGWKMGFEPTTKNHHIPHIINKLQQQLLNTCKSGYKYVHNFLLFEQRYTKIRK